MRSKGKWGEDTFIQGLLDQYGVDVDEVRKSWCLVPANDDLTYTDVAKYYQLYEENTLPIFDLNWTKAASWLHEWLRPVIMPPRILSYEEVGEYLDRSKSAGALLSPHVYKNKGQMLDDPKFKKAYYDFVQSFLNLEVDTLFSASLKEEIRDAEKVKAGNARAFIVAPPFHLILEHQLSHDFDLQFMENWLELGHGIGMSLAHLDYHRTMLDVWRFHLEHPEYGILDLDVSKYDKRLALLVQLVECDVINRFYDDNIDIEVLIPDEFIWPENRGRVLSSHALRRRLVKQNACAYVRMPGGEVVYTCGGQKSGTGRTGTGNTIGHKLINIAIAIHYGIISFEQYKTTVKDLFTGDDNFGSEPKDYSKFRVNAYGKYFGYEVQCNMHDSVFTGSYLSTTPMLYKYGNMSYIVPVMQPGKLLGSLCFKAKGADHEINLNRLLSFRVLMRYNPEGNKLAKWLIQRYIMGPFTDERRQEQWRDQMRAVGAGKYHWTDEYLDQFYLFALESRGSLSLFSRCLTDIDFQAALMDPLELKTVCRVTNRFLQTQVPSYYTMPNAQPQRPKAKAKKLAAKVQSDASKLAVAVSGPNVARNRARRAARKLKLAAGGVGQERYAVPDGTTVLQARRERANLAGAVRRIKPHLRGGANGVASVEAIASTIANPFGNEVVRIPDAIDGRSSATANVFYRVDAPWYTGASAYAPNEYPDGSQMCVTLFRNMTRAAVIYQPNQSGATWSHNLYFANRSNDASTVTAPTTTTTLKFFPSGLSGPMTDLPIVYAAATGTFRPHGDYLYAGSLTGEQGLGPRLIWIDANSTSNALVTATFDALGTNVFDLYATRVTANGTIGNALNFDATGVTTKTLTVTAPGYYYFTYKIKAADVTTFSMSITGTGPCMGHIAVPGFQANAQSVNQYRVVAGSILYTNDCSNLDRSGRCLALQGDGGKDWTEYAMSGSFSDLSNEDKCYQADIRKGVYSYLRPTNQIQARQFLDHTDWHNGILVDSFYPVLDKFTYLSHRYSITDNTGRSGRLTLTWQIEYYTTDPWRATMLSPVSEADYKLACEMLVSIPQHYENPTHIKDIANWLRNAGRSVGRAIAEYGPRALDLAATYGPSMLKAGAMLAAL